MRKPPFFFAAAVIFAGTACQKKDPVLARVGTQAVRASSFQEEVNGVPFSSRAYLGSPAGRRELLDLLIRRKIILQAAQENPTPGPALRERLAELEESYRQSRARLRQKYLEERERLWVSHYMDGLKNSRLSVTDDDVRRFWDAESEVRASHILVSDRILAAELRKKIAAGEKFEDLARARSEDPGTGQKDGDLGYLIRGSLVPEFENALFQMKAGEVSDPVASPYGFHLIKRIGDRKLSAGPLDDAAKKRIRAALESQKFQQWFDRTRALYAVSVNDDALDDLVVSTTSARP